MTFPRLLKQPLRGSFLALGLAAGLVSLAQTGGNPAAQAPGVLTPPGARSSSNAPLLVETAGRVQLQVGGNPPRMLSQGRPILASGILTTDDLGSAVIRFPNGRIVSVGPNSSVHLDAGQSGVSDTLNLIDGSMRISLDPTIPGGPGRLVFQAGTSTLTVPQGGDLAVVSNGGLMMVVSHQGAIQVRPLDGNIVAVNSGQAVWIVPNRGAQTGTIAQIDAIARQTAAGAAAANQVGALDSFVFAFSGPRARSTELLSRATELENQAASSASRGASGAQGSSAATSAGATPASAGTASTDSTSGTQVSSASAGATAGTQGSGSTPGSTSAVALQGTANSTSTGLPEVNVGLDELPPTADIGPTLNLPPLATATTGTTTTGAVAGGSPCTVSCN